MKAPRARKLSYPLTSSMGTGMTRDELKLARDVLSAFGFREGENVSRDVLRNVLEVVRDPKLPRA